MEEIKNEQTELSSTSKQLRLDRKYFRLFILFLVIDLILLICIGVEIFFLIKNGMDANAATQNTPEQVKEAIRLLLTL